MTVGRTLAGFRLIAAGLALIPFLLTSAQAQTAPSAMDPATLDVAGVRLGMTVDEAIAGLKSFDPVLPIKKRYSTNPLSSYASDGKDMSELYDADKSTAYFNDLYAIKVAPVQQCEKMTDTNRMPRCFDRHPDDEEVVKVWFSHVPGQERVIAVQRTKTFYKDPKYPKEQITYEIQGGWVGTIGWAFDSKRRLVSSAAAKQKRIENTSGLPGTVRPGDGIVLNVVLSGNNINNQIADKVQVTLSDADALYKSIDQAKATYAALKAQVDAKQVEKAAKGSSQTKF
jgi:hypothetical protein